MQKYSELRHDLIRTERHLLKEMGFICHVEHPHKFISNYLATLEAPELTQEAWNLANDRYSTPSWIFLLLLGVFVLHLIWKMFILITESVMLSYALMCYCGSPVGTHVNMPSEGMYSLDSHLTDL